MFHVKIAKTKDFTSRLQRLEGRLDKVEVPKTETHAGLLKETIKIIKDNLEKMLGEKQDFFSTHWPCLKKNIINSTGTAQKKEIIKDEIRYLKNYINTQKGIYWDEVNHTDILYIYWHSKNELEIIEKITLGLEFLDKEIIKLEKQNSKF